MPKNTSSTLGEHFEGYIAEQIRQERSIWLQSGNRQGKKRHCRRGMHKRHKQTLAQQYLISIWLYTYETWG